MKKTARGPYTLGIGIGWTRDMEGKLKENYVSCAGITDFNSASYNLRDAQLKAKDIMKTYRKHSEAYKNIEIGVPTEKEAISLGFSSLHHWNFHIYEVLEFLPQEILDKIKLVPRGSTKATKEAADGHF